MFTPESINKLRETVRRSDRDRWQYPNDHPSHSEIPRWHQRLPMNPIVTVLITEDVNAEGLYTGVVVDAIGNYVWDEGDNIVRVQPANVGDVLRVGRRYPATPSHADNSEFGTGTGTDSSEATDVYLAYCCENEFLNLLGTGTGSYGGPGVGTGTVPWYNFESSVVTIHNTVVHESNSTFIVNNVSETVTNSSFSFSTTTLTYNSGTVTLGPSLNLIVNVGQPVVVQQNLNFNLNNNVNLKIAPAAPGQNNLFQLFIPAQFNNGLFLPQAIVPAIVANQAPLNLALGAAGGDAPIFRLKINAAGLQMQGIAPAPAGVPAKMFGIVNAGPNPVNWPTGFNVSTPNSSTYTQAVNELLWFYADGSANQYVMSGHDEGTASGVTGLGTANYLPLWVDSDELTYSWIRQATGLTPYVAIAKPDAPDLSALKTTAPKLELGGTIGSPYVQFYASGADTLTIQLQTSPKFPLVTLATAAGTTYLDIDDTGTGNVCFSVMGNRGKTGTLRPGATTKGGVIDYLGTGEYGTAGGGGAGGDITAVNVTAPIAGGGTTGAVTISHAASGVTARNYTRPNLVVDVSGHVTFAEDGTGGDITAVNVTTPIAGGGASGAVTISHATSGVTARDYRRANVVVNSTGHVTLAEDGTGFLDINGLTEADPAFDDFLPEYNVAASANRKVKPRRLLGLHRLSPGGRLTMSSGNPVADSTAGSNLYYTPFKHDIIVLWDGTRWVPVVFAETQVTGGALSGLTSSRPYDVFAYLSSGALALEILVWTSVTTRATAVTYQDGRLCKSGDKTRLLMGSFYASSTTQTKHQMDLRHVDNIYWQEKTAIGVDLAGNWTYGTNTWRQVNGGTGGYKVEVMCSQPKSITCRSLLYVIGSVGAGASAGIGIDSTSAVHADADWCENQSPAPSVAWVETQLGAGLRTIYPLEIARAGTLNIYGESASAVQGGLKGSVMM